MAESQLLKDEQVVLLVTYAVGLGCSVVFSFHMSGCQRHLEQNRAFFSQVSPASKFSRKIIPLQNRENELRDVNAKRGPVRTQEPIACRDTTSAAGEWNLNEL